KKAEDYELIIIPDFISSAYISHGWYYQNVYQISFDYYYSVSYKQGKVVWLNQNKQSIGETGINPSMFVDNYRLLLDNVPEDAYYFYFYIEGKKGDISVSLKSAPYPIEERYPSNIQILGENISNVNLVKYIPEIQKILILDRSNYYLHVIDFATFTKEKQVALSSSPYCLAYSAYDNKIYIGTQNGRVYSFGLSDNSPSLVRNLSSSYILAMIAVNKYLIVTTSDYNLKILDLEDKSVTTHGVSYSYYNLIFNKTKNVVYGSGYGELLRFNFNPDSGSISNLSTDYVSSSDYYYMILFPDDSKLISSNGYIYNCSANIGTDLTQAGYLGDIFSCGYFLNNNNSIATLVNSSYYSSPPTINIYSANNYQLQGTKEDFYGTPIYMLFDGNVVKVIESLNNKIMVELFTYSDLISGSISSNKLFKENYFLSKKLSVN
ncbi:MAG TPA: hypothetical protein VMT35_08690, partial [Ignavibacteriaceae bacterium]|nr:hypothetical protein [Ignavibacteriaceae bacterium]